MKKSIFLLGLSALLFTACTGIDNEPDDSQNEIYKKAVVKLVKEQRKSYSVDKDLVDYSKEVK